MPRKSPQRNGSPLYWSAESWAFISLRLFLGLRFLLAGLGKFKNENGDYSFAAYYGENGTVAKISDLFQKTDIPGFLVSAYAHSIAHVQIILGFLLLAGVKTKWVLALYALTIVSLAYGQMILGNNATVNEIGIYLILTSAALYFVRHNKLESLR